MTSALHAKGGLLKRSTDGGSTYTTIAEVTDINVDESAEDIDATSHDSGSYRERIYGMLDVGVTFTINFNPSQSTQTGVRGLLRSKTVGKFRYIAPGGGEQIDFDALVTQASTPVPVDGKLSMDITLANTGTPTFS